MLKEGRLVEWNNGYFEIITIGKDYIHLKVRHGLISVLKSDVKEITNDNVEWSKIPKDTEVYYHNKQKKEYSKYLFVRSYIDEKDLKLYVRYKSEETDFEFETTPYYNNIYIMDDWLEKQILSNVHDYEDELINDMTCNIKLKRHLKCRTEGCNNVVEDIEDTEDTEDTEENGYCRSCYIKNMNEKDPLSTKMNEKDKKIIDDMLSKYEISSVNPRKLCEQETEKLSGIWENSYIQQLDIIDHCREVITLYDEIKILKTQLRRINSDGTERYDSLVHETKKGMENKIIDLYLILDKWIENKQNDKKKRLQKLKEIQ